MAFLDAGHKIQGKTSQADLLYWPGEQVKARHFANIQKISDKTTEHRTRGSNVSKTRTHPRIILIGLFALLLLAAESSVAEESMTLAASNFLAALTAAERDQASFAFDTDERESWHFIPNEMFPRSGISLKDLNAQQRDLAHMLLSTGLSQAGYLTATAIIQLERVLNELEAGGRFARDHDDYLISIFDTPQTDGTWAWRFEGHHLSLHFTVVAGELTVSTPSFFGSNPAEVRTGAQTPEQEGQRVLAAREDTGRALVRSLDSSQRDKAITDDTAPRDIITGNQYPIDPFEPIGINFEEMNSSQQSLLRDLITAYTSSMSGEIAALRWGKIREDGLESINFSWAGSIEFGQPHYYRVQGASFLIEYDNTQNNANHIHSTWRDFEGDFGRDVLREHYDSVSH